MPLDAAMPRIAWPLSLQDEAAVARMLDARPAALLVEIEDVDASALARRFGTSVTAFAHYKDIDFARIEVHDPNKVQEAVHAEEIASALDDAEVRRVDADSESELTNRPATLHSEPFDDQAEADGVRIAGSTF